MGNWSKEISASLQALHDKLDALLKALEQPDIATLPSTTGQPPAIVQSQPPSSDVPPTGLTKPTQSGEFTISPLVIVSGHANPCFQLMLAGKTQDLVISSKDEMYYIDAVLWLDPVLDAKGNVIKGTAIKIGQKDYTHTLDVGALTRAGMNIVGSTVAVVIAATEDVAAGNANPMEGQGETTLIDVV